MNEADILRKAEDIIRAHQPTAWESAETSQMWRDAATVLLWARADLVIAETEALTGRHHEHG